MEQPSLPSLDLGPNHRRWLVWALVILTTAFIVGLGFAVNHTAQPAFCGSCHEMSVYVTSWKAREHKKVGCLGCHQDPGMMGAVSYRLRMVRYFSLTKIYLRRHRPALTTGGFSACADCHQQVLKRPIVSEGGLRVSHREIADAGIGCDRCHIQVGHESRAMGLTRPMHDYCFACHEKEEREQDCSFCHTKDISVAGTESLGDYRKVNIESINDCSGCHATQSCQDCHIDEQTLLEY